MRTRLSIGIKVNGEELNYHMVINNVVLFIKAYRNEPKTAEGLGRLSSQ